MKAWTASDATTPWLRERTSPSHLRNPARRTRRPPHSSRRSIQAHRRSPLRPWLLEHQHRRLRTLPGRPPRRSRRLAASYPGLRRDRRQGGVATRDLSLSRLAVVPEVGTNAASIFIAAMLRDLRQEGRWVSAVTFADESQGHHGGIYAATNWVYEGRTKPEPRWVDEDGKQVSRLSTKSRAAFVMEILGHRVEGRFSKHRYTMRLAAYPPLERPPSPPAWRRAFRRLGVRS